MRRPKSTKWLHSQRKATFLCFAHKAVAIFVQCTIISSSPEKAFSRQRAQDFNHSNRQPPEGPSVMTTDEINKLGKDNMELAMNSFGAWSKTAQAIAAEVVD